MVAIGERPAAAARSRAGAASLSGWVIVATGTILVIALGRLLIVAVLQLGAPFDLSFESPNLATIEVLRAGGNVYDPGLFAQPPFIWTLYTPLYHYLVAPLPAAGDNPFLVGRLVALAGMIGAATTVLFVARTATGRVAALLAIGGFFLVGYLVSSASALRNDSLALLFSAAAVVWLARSMPQAGLPSVFGAALLVVLAVAAKQSYVAAAAALSLWLLLADWRRGLAFIAAGAALGLVGAGFAQLVWGSGFWTSILNTGTHPWTLGHWQLVWNESTAEAPAVAVLLAGAGAGGYAVSRSGWGALREAPYLVYFLVSWAVLAATLGKVGSSSNYFYEPLLTSLLLAVWAADRYQPVAAVRAAAPLLAALAILTLLAPAGVYSFLPRPLWHERAFENQIAAAPSEATRAAYATEVAALVPTPARILNLATPQLQFARDGLGDPLQSELILNDPFLYSAIFGSTLPAAALDRPIREQAFDLLILPREWQPGMRFPDSTLAAIADAYIPAGTGVFHYFLPRQ